MGDWLKGHAFQIFSALMLVAIAAGTWKGQLDVQNLRLSDLERRVVFLEDRYTNEQTRLSAVYMNRDLSLQQYSDIGRQLDDIKSELRLMRGGK